MVGRILSIIVALVAVAMGALYNGLIPTDGLLRWLGNAIPGLTGMAAPFTPLPWGFTYDQYNKDINLKGKLAIVTGGNSGIGYYAALNMARKGAKVILACRNPMKCEKASLEMIQNITSTNHNDPNIVQGGSVECMTLDTSILSSVRNFVKQFLDKYGDSPLDILLLNSGIGYDYTRPNGTVDGIEATFATNYVGHYLLYKLLKRNLFYSANQSNGDVRVVLTTSATHYTAKYIPLTNKGWLDLPNDMIYPASKLAQILFVKEASKQLLKDAKESMDDSFTNIYINAAHPGLVETNIFAPFNDLMGQSFSANMFLKFVDFCRTKGWMWNAEYGALTILYLATSPTIVEKKIRGSYFVPQGIRRIPNKLATNETLQKELWKFTDTLVVTH